MLTAVKKRIKRPKIHIQLDRERERDGEKKEHSDTKREMRRRTRMPNL